MKGIKDTKNEHLQELEMQFAKVKTAQALCVTYEKEMDDLRSKLNHANQDNMQIRDTMKDRQKDIEQLKMDVAEEKGNVSKLKSILSVRSETNSVLRQQLEEVSGNSFVITKAEMDRYKKTEKEFQLQAFKIKELSRAIDQYMDTIASMEQEILDVRDEGADNEKKLKEVNQVLFETKKQVGSTGDREKILKREIIKCRKERQDLAERVAELEVDPLAKDAEYQNMRQTLAGATKGRETELDLKLKEGRKRKMAEESLQALRNRVNFLLEQLEAASKLAIGWQEERVLFKSEVDSLHNINRDLRKRLSTIQSNFIHRQVPGLVESDRSEEAANVLSGKGDLHVDTLGEAFEGNITHSFPVTLESYVERALFDTICAFSSGTRTMKNTTRKSDTSGKFKFPKASASGTRPKFKVVPVEKDAHKGRVEIVMAYGGAKNSNKEDDANAQEILVGTQINSFLNFCQSRPPEKAGTLYAEKICHLLNFIFSYIQDMVDQLSTARLELAQVTSRAVVTEQRCDQLRLQYSVERTAKQKNAMKYVREQMRLSDIRILLDDLYSKSTNFKEELELSGAAFMDANKNMISILVEIGSVTHELSLAGASSGTATGGIGALEIRLPDSEIDDETFFNIVTLLSGGADTSTGTEDTKTEGEEETKDGVGGTTMHSKVLAKAIRSVSQGYISRIVMLNLKGNHLTDIACSTLAKIIEKSSNLRMVDLRENIISDDGAKMLFEACRKNVTIMYVTQRQNGFMIEGHREISGTHKSQGGQKNDSEPTGESARAEFERLIDGPKFPLRIDIRYNDKSHGVVDHMFEQVDYSRFTLQQQDRKQHGVEEAGRAGKSFSPVGIATPVPDRGTAMKKSPYAYADSPRGRSDGNDRSSSPYAMSANPATHNSPSSTAQISQSSSTPNRYGAHSGGTSQSPYVSPEKEKAGSYVGSSQGNYGNSYAAGSPTDKKARVDLARVSWSSQGVAQSVSEELKSTTRPKSILNELNGTLEKVPNPGKATYPPRPLGEGNSNTRAALNNNYASNQNRAFQSFASSGGFDSGFESLKGSTGGFETLTTKLSNSDSVTGHERTEREDSGHAGLIALIESHNTPRGSAADGSGSMIDNRLRGNFEGDVGGVLDNQIRIADLGGEGTGAYIGNSGNAVRIEDFDTEAYEGKGSFVQGDKKTKKEKTVKEKILSNTKKIYNNKNMFPSSMATAVDPLEAARKRPSSAAAKGSGSVIPASLEYGGGNASVNAASTVRSKLLQARENDNPQGNTPSRAAKRSKSAGISRPSSAKNGTGAKKKNDKSGAAGTGARGLLSSLKKLNPAVLF